MTIRIIALILPLSLDTFAVSVALGVSGASSRALSGIVPAVVAIGLAIAQFAG
jgi:hypothetical protein